MIHEIVPETESVARVKLKISQHKLLIHNLAQYGLCHRVGFRTLSVVLDTRVVQLGIGPFTVLRLLAELVECLLAAKLSVVLVDDLLGDTLVIVLCLFQAEQRGVA